MKIYFTALQNNDTKELIPCEGSLTNDEKEAHKNHSKAFMAHKTTNYMIITYKVDIFDQSIEVAFWD